MTRFLDLLRISEALIILSARDDPADPLRRKQTSPVINPSGPLFCVRSDRPSVSGYCNASSVLSPAALIASAIRKCGIWYWHKPELAWWQTKDRKSVV